MKRMMIEVGAVAAPLLCGIAGIAMAMDPCNECVPDPEAVASLGHVAEDDNLAAPQGSGLDEASPIDCLSGSSGPTEGWRGANDHCWRQVGDPALKEVLPSVTGVGQVVSLCGRTMNISNFCHFGLYPREDDPDVYEFQITGAEARVIRMTAYSERAGLRVAITFSLEDAIAGEPLGPFDDCSDVYGLYTAWDPRYISTPASCEVGVWEEELEPGYYYLIVVPEEFEDGGPAQGEVSSDGDSFWYNVTLESLGGSACVGDLDGDGDTDTLDFAIFAPNFGRTDLVPGTDGDYDFDGDCDTLDFAIFAPDFGCTP